MLWFGVSVEQLCFGFDSNNSDVAVGWTVCTATVLCVAQSEQQLCCGFDSHYRNCILGWTVSTVTEL